MAILYFGTNLLFYGIREPSMSHAYTFCLVAALIYVLPAFWSTPSVYFGFGMSDVGSVPKSDIPNPTSKALLVGFLVSLIALIRPTNALFALVVLLYDVSNLTDLKNRFIFIFHNIKILWIVPCVGILMAIPQLMYWHYLSGHWFLNIYTEIFHVTFKWGRPEFYKVLFHPCNGFLLYNPLMWFTLVGMTWTALKNQLNGRLIVGIFLITFFLSACWDMWWFGHAFGYRPFIDYYPLMIFGLAFYINELLKSKMLWFKYLNLSVFIGLMFINFRYTIIPFYWQVEPDGSRIEDFWKAWNWVFDISKWE